jgi:hypothetical protein
LFTPLHGAPASKGVPLDSEKSKDTWKEPPGAAVEEFERQGVAEAMSNLSFDPMALARAVIKAADGDVIELISRRDR